MALLICAAVWLVTSSTLPVPCPLPLWQLPQLVTNKALPSIPPELLELVELELDELELEELEPGQLVPLGAASEVPVTSVFSRHFAQATEFVAARCCRRALRLRSPGRTR